MLKTYKARDAADQIQAIMLLHEQFEKRVYELEMRLANERINISDEQLIAHPLHNITGN
jgi:hypothetical protein